VLTGVLSSIVVQAFAVRAQQQRGIDRRELAAVEASNLMEQLTSLPYAELTAERAAGYKLSEELERVIPAAKLEVTIDPIDEKPAAKRIRVEIDYAGPAGQPTRSVSLTSWVYRLEKQVAVVQAVQP
jgi:hypothetical protein